VVLIYGHFGPGHG